MHRNTALVNAGLWMFLSLAASHLTEQQTSTIVDVHNGFRSQVWPSAVFMQKVVWDETLRLVAEAYAAKCIWDHNPELDSLKLGENLFVTTGPLNVTEGIIEWFEENQDYDYENNTCTEDKMCGHYTQMVWADSKRIGCAAHVCETLEGLESAHKYTLLVCNYYPTGNYEGQKPYESGESCSKCPEKLPECEENICVTLPLAPETTQHPSISTEKSTPASEKSTPAPEGSTPASEESTPAPEKSTPAPEKFTPASEKSTPAPEESTPAPEKFTPAPEGSTPASEEPTPAPEKSTPALEEPTPASEEPTQGHKEIEKTGTKNAGSETERTLAPLLMLVWISAAFIL